MKALHLRLLLCLALGMVATPGYGQLQNALNFELLYDHVQVTSDPTLNFGTGDFTIEAWIQNENTLGLPWKRIVTKRDAGSSWYSMVLINNQLGMELSGVYNFFAGPVIQGDGQWHHVAAVRQGISIHLYVDGAKYSNTNPGYGLNLNNTANLELGTLGGEAYGGETYEGLMDEIRIWNIARTDSQITDNMNRELANPPAEPNLVLYYKCNQIGLPFVPDNSLYGNLGILFSNPATAWVESTAPVPVELLTFVVE